MGVCKVKSLQRREDGAAAVEFALVAIPFVVLLLGTIQFAWYFYGAQSATAAAREGARQLVVGECWGNFESYVKGQSPLVTSATVSPSPASASIGDTLTVTVKANAGVIDFFNLPGEVTRVFQARLEDTSPGGTTTC